MVDRGHGNLAGELAGHFWVYRTARGGELGPERRLRLAPRRYVKPDMAYYAPGSAMDNDDLPTLCIEARSRSETMAS